MSHPKVKWAQRKDKLFITIDVQDIQDEVMTLTADKLLMTGKSGDGAEYKVEIDTFKECDPEHEDSKWAKTGRQLKLQIMKKDKEEEEHWPRLTKEKVKLQWLVTDWSLFVDEDEEDEAPAGGMDMGGMGQGFGGGGMGGMGGMGGPGGMGGMDMSQLMAQMGGAGGMGGMGGMPGMPPGMDMGAGDDEPDSDDDLPDLDEADGADGDGDADDVD